MQGKGTETQLHTILDQQALLNQTLGVKYSVLV
jgi:hypothetical protein